jgi:two-component system chemotaxis sensor kinase CheA
VIILDGHTLPLRTLADVLNFEKMETPAVSHTYSVVIIKADRQCVALLVDKIIGEREIVIKRLNLPLFKVSCIAGATLLERNQVVTVLNPNDLIHVALHLSTMQRVVAQDALTKKNYRPRILVVDDSITTRTLEKNILENKNYQVTVAVNGKEAWDLLQDQSFSLLITDVSMPIMDGFTLTEYVKQSEKLNKLPVIIVTSLGSDEEKERGIKVGADAYIIKNEFESGSLLEIVEQLV